MNRYNNYTMYVLLHRIVMGVSLSVVCFVGRAYGESFAVCNALRRAKHQDIAVLTVESKGKVERLYKQLGLLMQHALHSGRRPAEECVEEVDDIAALVDECRELCRELNIDDTEIAWDTLQEALLNNRGCSFCTPKMVQLFNKVQTIKTKTCAIALTIGFGTVPLEQADFPLLIDGNTNKSGLYCFTENITTTSPAICITIPDVKIDFKCFTLCGPGSGTGVKVNASRVQIQNGTVKDFGTNIQVANTGTSTISDIGITDMTLVGATNAAAASLDVVANAAGRIDGVVIDDVVMRASAGYGLRLQNTTHTSVSDVESWTSGLDGVRVNAATEFTFNDIAVADATGDGIDMLNSQSGSVTEFKVATAGGCGVKIQNTREVVVQRGDVFSATDPGVCVRGTSQNVLVNGVTAEAGSAEGFIVEGGATAPKNVIIAGSLSQGNADSGFEVSSGAVTPQNVCIETSKAIDNATGGGFGFEDGVADSTRGIAFTGNMAISNGATPTTTNYNEATLGSFFSGTGGNPPVLGKVTSATGYDNVGLGTP